LSIAASLAMSFAMLASVLNGIPAATRWAAS
jgi:hypothetical protein